ncbi:MAG TPA: glycine cleavage system aminomethyltransferase GcvT, partial [Bacteroidales bacterium]|nr:glycine cleavage system aminomethyltransferase GcvT [Bacteroidales bacterium]
TGVNDEHIAVRTTAGVFDVSHMGEFFVSGPDAFNLVQYLTSNDVSLLTVGKVQYSCLPNGKGGIVDDLLVYRTGDEEYMLVVNASNIEKDWNWIQSNNKFNDVRLRNDSDDISLLAVQGPKAVELLQKLTDISLADIAFYTFHRGEFSGIPDVIFSATGYTGAGGFELYFHNAEADKIWNLIFEAGEEYGIKPAGLAARDTLRLEMGYCLYGNDIDDTTSPIEAGLGWITKFKTGNDFIDCERLEKQKKEGVSRKLVAFELIDRGIPRQHYKVADAQGNEIGEVTSGTMSPMLKKGIGMGYVPVKFAKAGTEIFIAVRNKMLRAKIVKLPFYKG